MQNCKKVEKIYNRKASDFSSNLMSKILALHNYNAKTNFKLKSYLHMLNNFDTSSINTFKIQLI